MAEQFDVVVVGGGLMGLVAAEALARPGKRIGYLPSKTAEELPSHALLLSATNPLYVDIGWKAIARWSPISQRAGTALLRLTGGWECATEKNKQIEAIRENFIRYPIPFEDLTLGKNYVRFPHFFLEPGESAIFYSHAGVVETAKAQDALDKLVDNAGVVRLPAGIDSLIPLEKTVRLADPSGNEWTTNQLVLLDPTWFDQVRVSLPLYTTYLRVIEFEALAAYRTGYEMGQMAVMVDRSQATRLVMATPHKSPAGHHLIWSSPTPPDETTDAEIQAFTRRRLPYLDPRPGKATTHTITTTPDDNFILDFHPDFPHILIGTGFGYEANPFASVVGEAMAQLMHGEMPRINTSFFSLTRFM